MTRPIRAVGALLTMSMVLVLSGCGGATSETPTPAGTSGHTPSPTKTPKAKTQSPAPKGKAVGNVQNVPNAEAYVDGERAQKEGKVRRGSQVSTNDGGAIEFNVNGSIDSCTMWHGSKVEVMPSDAVVLQFIAGTTTCTTTKGKEVTLEIGDQSTVTTSDPVLIVSINGTR
jgi:hypothetical protein